MDKKTRAVAWVKDRPFGVEFAEVTLTRRRLTARGVALGTVPVPYRPDYALETRAGFVTSRLWVSTRAQGWLRVLDLRREASGIWSAAVVAEGETPLPPPGGEDARLAGALDCDLGFSPLTNSLPVLRHQLLGGGGPVDLRVAWISVPDLAIYPDGQRYTYLQAGRGRHIVRYEAIDGTFAADIVFDQDGIVIDYPGIARRLT